MTATIFLGPSLSIDEARRIVPDAVFRPPAAQGDLLGAVDQDGADLIGLIDGTFHQNLSVWHNEVCFLLSRGITIFGASSMGALRAVETERYGMVGIGTVFNWYRDGTVNADDEVALLHGSGDSGYASLSLPLVNVRASAANAVTIGSLGSEFSDRLIEIARGIYYPERHAHTLVEACGVAGFPPDQLQAMEAALTTGYVDVKRSDAVLLLETVRDVLAGIVPRPAPVEFSFARSSVFEAMYNLDRPIRVGDDEVRLQDVAEHVALYSTEFDQLRADSLNRDIVAYFALLLGLRVTEDELAVQQSSFRQARALEDPDALQAWLAENAMSERDLSEYLTQEALCTRMRRWMIAIRGFDRGARPILNELRKQGEFSRWAKSAAEESVVVDAYRHRPEYEAIEQEHPARLADLHAAFTGVHIAGDVRLWAEIAGFEDAGALEDALRRSVILNDVRRKIAVYVDALELQASELAVN